MAKYFAHPRKIGLTFSITPTTGSGFTMTRTSVQRDQTLRRVVQKNLSMAS